MKVTAYLEKSTISASCPTAYYTIEQAYFSEHQGMLNVTYCKYDSLGIALDERSFRVSREQGNSMYKKLVRDRGFTRTPIDSDCAELVSRKLSRIMRAGVTKM